MAACGLVDIYNWQLHQLNPEMFDHVSWLGGLVDIYNWQLHQLNPKMFDHVSWVWKALVPIQFIPFWGIGFIWGLLVGLILLGKCSKGKIHCLGCRLNLTLLGSIIVLSCFQTNNPLQLSCKLSTSIYFGSFMQLSCHHMGLILYDNKFLRAERVRQIKHFNEDRLTPGNLPGEFCNGTRWNGFATESLSHHSLPLFAIVRVLSVCDEQFGFADCCINMFGWFMKGPSCWLEVICLALMMFNWRWSTTFAQGCSPEHQSKTFVFELGVICGVHTMVSFCWLFEVWVQLDTECNPTWLTNGCFGGLEDGWQHQCVQQGQEHCPNAWASFVTCNIHLQGPDVPHVHASHWQVCWDTCFGFGMG